MLAVGKHNRQWDAHEAQSEINNQPIVNQDKPSLPELDHATMPNLRQAMRGTAGAVAIITTGFGHEKTGATVTSANSFSIDPQEMMVAINLNSSTWQAIEKYNIFCVNYLGEETLFLAEQFSGKHGLKGIERYRGGKWQQLATGAPVLTNALSAIDCEVSEIIIRNSHALIFGKVRAILTNKGNPLLFHDGVFKPLTAHHADHSLK